MPLSVLALAHALALGLSACGAPEAPPPPSAPPVAVRDAVPVSEASEKVRVDVSELVTGLEHPWGLAILPDGGMLVTERPGRLRRIGADGTVSAPIAGLPKI